MGHSKILHEQPSVLLKRRAAPVPTFPVLLLDGSEFPECGGSEFPELTKTTPQQNATPAQPELMSEEEIPLEVVDSNGDPGGSRTPNPQIRSLMLYPVELRGQHLGTFVGN